MITTMLTVIYLSSIPFCLFMLITMSNWKKDIYTTIILLLIFLIISITPTINTLTVIYLLTPAVYQLHLSIKKYLNKYSRFVTKFDHIYFNRNNIDLYKLWKK